MRTLISPLQRRFGRQDQRNFTSFSSYDLIAIESTLSAAQRERERFERALVALPSGLPTADLVGGLLSALLAERDAKIAVANAIESAGMDELAALASHTEPAPVIDQVFPRARARNSASTLIMQKSSGG